MLPNEWDYTEHARYYEYRPNYSARAIELLLRHVRAEETPSFLVADIGAGTANLSLLLVAHPLRVVAIEPNASMWEIGRERTRAFRSIRWVSAMGTSSGLKSHSVDWACYGSSFNVMDRELALLETHRILKKGGFVTVLWNHRDLEDPIQEAAEKAILNFIPNYERGIRRTDQRPFFQRYQDQFTGLLYIEHDFEVTKTIEQYIYAWRSVRNKYWDLSTEQGRQLFESIAARMETDLPAEFAIRYTTRAWTAQRKP